MFYRVHKPRRLRCCLDASSVETPSRGGLVFAVSDSIQVPVSLLPWVILVLLLERTPLGAVPY